MLEQEFFEFIGLEPIYEAIKWELDPDPEARSYYACNKIFNNYEEAKKYHESCKSFGEEPREIKRKITAYHILALEELIITGNKFCHYIEWFCNPDSPEKYYQCQVRTNNYRVNDTVVENGKTRQEALLNLIKQLIEQNILTKEEIREVFE